MILDKSLASEREALALHLEIHGPELARWPVPAQQRFAGLLASDDEAQRSLREAKALELIVIAGLETPEPVPPAGHLASLRDRILHQAAAEQGRSGHPLPPLHRRAHVTADRRGRVAASARGAQRYASTADLQKPAASSRLQGLAMAACLILGLAVGAFGSIERLFAPAKPLMTASIDGELITDDAEFAFGSIFADFDDEESL